MTEAARPVINLVSGTYYDNVDFDTPEVRAHMVCGEGETLLVSNPSLGSSGVWAIFPHGDASGTRLVDGLITDWNGKVWGTPLRPGIYPSSVRLACVADRRAVRSMTVRVDVVVSGVDYLSDGRDHPMHHTHLGLYDEIQAMIRIYNGHHHLHADSPLTKVIRNIMGHIVGLKTQLTAQSSRITALETAVTALQAAHAEGSAETEDSEAE